MVQSYRQHTTAVVRTLAQCTWQQHHAWQRRRAMYHRVTRLHTPCPTNTTQPLRDARHLDVQGQSAGGFHTRRLTATPGLKPTHTEHATWTLRSSSESAERQLHNCASSTVHPGVHSCTHQCCISANPGGRTVQPLARSMALPLSPAFPSFAHNHLAPPPYPAL